MFAWFGSVLACDSTLRKADWLMALGRTMLLPIDSQGGGKTNRKKVKFEIPTHVGSRGVSQLASKCNRCRWLLVQKKSLIKAIITRLYFRGDVSQTALFSTILIPLQYCSLITESNFGFLVTLNKLCLLKLCKSHKALLRKRMKNVISNKPH